MHPGDAPEFALQGVQSFLLPDEDRIAILVDDRNLCSGSYKGANCHAYGCDVRIYAKDSSGLRSRTIVDKPIAGQIFTSISVKHAFTLAAFYVSGELAEQQEAPIAIIFCFAGIKNGFGRNCGNNCVDPRLVAATMGATL